MTLPQRTILAVIGLALVGLAPAAARFHTRLEKSAPAKDATLSAAPAEIRLWFNERVEARLSSIALVGADSAAVPLGKVAATDDPMSITARVTGPMKPGTYTVRWRTAGRDGHAVRGSFSFALSR